MTVRILIDGLYSEDIRVVLCNNSVIENFDCETSSKQQLKGNIYLAKVTRVEAGLQAAFVEFGGTKQGFLPFGEIHPNYYAIPIADRQSLIEAASKQSNEPSIELAENNSENKLPEDSILNEFESNLPINEESNNYGNRLQVIEEDAINAEAVDDIGDEENDNKNFQNMEMIKRYKIQEVVKRNQILLVQVTKEERGNKCPTVTTYMSIAGRYCVLMPNSLHQGGISRRISDLSERKRLKQILDGLKINDMSLIIRTAGAKCDETEIKRDYEYLVRLWNNIREHTLSATAPAFIHAEGDLIRRSIRDMFRSHIGEIYVQGKAAYEAAYEFTKLLMPSDIHKLKLYSGNVPIFMKFNIENQLATFYDTHVPLPSGGSIVINHTEALTAIDVNSGKATSERNVEETAFKTNQEAAVEIARQLRIRDVGGLIVIDFIDMSEFSHRISVERLLRESLQNDRARIQMGRISHFGLLEMSRQRLRPSVIEASYVDCKTCSGRGIIRAPESMANKILRNIESLAATHHLAKIIITVSPNNASYLLNEKRRYIVNIETKYNLDINILEDSEISNDNFKVESVRSSTHHKTNQSLSTIVDVLEKSPTDNNNTKSHTKNKKPYKKKTHSHNNNEPTKPDNVAEPLPEKTHSQLDTNNVQENSDNVVGSSAQIQETTAPYSTKPKSKRTKRYHKKPKVDATGSSEDQLDVGNQEEPRSIVKFLKKIGIN